jgi:hypothetical protein
MRRTITRAIKEGTEEALQEAGQQIANNLIASKMVGYDPERETRSRAWRRMQASALRSAGCSVS